MNKDKLSPLSLGILGCLIAQLVVMPVQAAKKSLALIPVVGSNALVAEQNQLWMAVKDQLQTKQKMHLADEDKLKEYFIHESQGESTISEGDQLFIEAKQSYLQFDNKKAESVLDKAIEHYASNPGTQGGLYQAYLLKAQLEDDNNQSSKAKKSIENAISQNPGVTELSDTFYSPRFRQKYKSVREEFVKNTPLTNLKVTVLGDGNTQDIFLNGENLGKGPQIQVQVIPDRIQFLQAGHSGKLYRIQPHVQDNNEIKIRSKLNKTKGSEVLAYSFSSQTPNLAREAQWMGKNVEANTVVLLSAQKNKKGLEMVVTALDVTSGQLTEPKSFEFTNFTNELPRVAPAMANYINSLKATDFTQDQDMAVPIVDGEKKSKAWIWVVGGVVVAGTVAGIILATSKKDPNAGVSILLPPDAVEDPDA